MRESSLAPRERKTVNRKIILIYRDRPTAHLQALEHSGIHIQWASTLAEARHHFEHMPFLDAVVVDLENRAEQGLEFCDIVHVRRPDLPIIFVRSANRLSLAPHCAHRVLDPDISEQDLAREIQQALEEPGALRRKRA